MLVFQNTGKGIVLPKEVVSKSIITLCSQGAERGVCRVGIARET